MHPSPFLLLSSFLIFTNVIALSHICSRLLSVTSMPEYLPSIKEQGYALAFSSMYMENRADSQGSTKHQKYLNISLSHLLSNYQIQSQFYIFEIYLFLKNVLT